MKLAKGLNRATLSSLGQRQEQLLEQGAWDETIKELDNGWLWEDKSCDLSQHVVAKRFGIKQGGKIRVIDDCSCCGLNGSVGLKEKFKLHSVDQLASMIAYSFGVSGQRHPPLLGRTYDLKSAYKQFPVCEDRRLLRIAVNEPGVDQPRIMGVNVLPFGAVGSVAAFLRISVAIWYVGIRCLGLFWSSFYDDFSVVTRVELQQNTAWACEALFNLLGMKFANSGAKYIPFAEKFKMLGLMMDLSQSDQKKIFLGHTEERAAELGEQLQMHLDSGKMSSKEAERLRGRMLFYESFTFGRLSGEAIKAVGRLACGNRPSVVFRGDVKQSLEFLLGRVTSASPIAVTQKLKECWYIFTDGACEAEKSLGSIGGVLLTPTGECIRYFSSKVPESLMSILLQASKNPIHELEVMPVLVSIMIWAGWVNCAPLVHYIAGKYLLASGLNTARLLDCLISGAWFKRGLSAILCMETNPNQPPLACLLGFSGITSLVIMVWLKATAAGLGLGQLQLFAICCSLWFWFSSFVFLLIYGGFPFAERRQNTPS